MPERHTFFNVSIYDLKKETPERHTFFNVSIADIKQVNFFWVNRMFTLISHPYNTKAYCESISLFLYHSNRLNKKTAMTKSIFQFF